MKLKLLLSIVLAVFVISCGKKEDPTTTQQQQKDTLKQNTQQQNTQQQNTEQQQTQKQVPPTNDDGTPKLTDAEKKKADEKLKAEEKKLADEKKKQELAKQNQNTDASSDVNFAEIWSKKCVKCHGKDGKGKVEGVPNLTKGETKSKSDKQLISIITNGKQGETEDDEDMPAWKNKLTEDEIKAAARYVKGL